MIYRNYNFTETVKKALNIAERITVKAENSSIDTPYVVYGLLSVDCVSKTTLNSFGIYTHNFILTSDKMARQLLDFRRLQSWCSTSRKLLPGRRTAIISVQSIFCLLFFCPITMRYVF